MRIDLAAVLGIIGTIWVGVSYSINPLIIIGLVAAHIIALNIKVN